MKIYIAMHKLVTLHLTNSLYEPLLVGAFNKSTNEILRDDSGDNISNKNDNYCELTGVYWIWKNSEEDIVGICHYRRFLSKWPLSISNKHFLNFDDIDNLMNKKNYNLILPKKIYFPSRIISANSNAPNEKDMSLVRQVILEKYPDYINDYDIFIESSSLYICNVMIARKEIFDMYCKWLFDILFEVERKLDKKTYIYDPYRKRMFGFISERLLNIWVLHNKDQLKIKEYPLINIELTFLQRSKRYLVQRLRGIRERLIKQM